MSTKTKYHIRKRIFLNRSKSMTAFAVGIVEDTREYKDENEDAWKWGKIELALSDCNRKIYFDFDLSDAEERSNSLYKIRRLAQVINGVKDAIEKEAASRAKRRPPKKKEEKKAG